MKKILYFSLIICLMSCQSERLDMNSEAFTIQKSSSTAANKQTETVVIRFTEGLSITEKAAIRASYGVVAYETCSCGDKNLESWDLEDIYEGATIEERVSSMEQDPVMEGADFNFNINISSQVPTVAAATTIHYQQILSKIHSQKADVCIGVLDTGIDPSYFGFQQPFLHNSSSDEENCDGDFFGWNFVDNNHMPIDDNGHGTIVSYLAYQQLENTGTNFEILPAKAFDATGNGSLFNVGCGLSYLIKKDVNIINMSFGWTETASTIIGDYIKEVEQRILIVTSAGNTGANNDVVAHYPSSYTTRNILAVTAVNNATPPNLVVSLSNYGQVSVDIAVKGVGLPFYTMPDAAPISITGSSYSSAKATGFAASKYHASMELSVFYDKILIDKIQSDGLHQIKYASYLDL
ncbi:S8 family peptidase [Kordia sp.]|uniref:S8 family peptidase n=1 Tax=Kordia sp. TaxID=1965332 RepID=UPI003B596B36